MQPRVALKITANGGGMKRWGLYTLLSFALVFFLLPILQYVTILLKVVKCRKKQDNVKIVVPTVVP